MFSTETGPITIAHDYFTQRGGAERVAAALIDALEPSRVVTAVHSPARTFPFRKSGKFDTTFLQHIRIIRNDPRRALAVFPFAWHSMAPVREGVVICSSSGWSHALRTEGSAIKIVYCHNPARWLYQPADYFKDQALPIRLIMRAMRPLLMRWDLHAAETADIYIANSTAVAERVKAAYNRDVRVIHPPISIRPADPQKAVAGVAPGYFLSVGRGRGYKNIDKLLAAFTMLPTKRLVVVGSAPAEARPLANVTFLTTVSDSQLRWLYSNAAALLSVSHEDFGLTPLEANAMGTPALVLRAGGFLDSTDEDVSGKFIETSTAKAIAAAVTNFPGDWDTDLIRQHAAQFSMDAFLHQLENQIAYCLQGSVPSQLQPRSAAANATSRPYRQSVDDA